MSAVTSPIDRRPSPSFTNTNPFASNNPFRNRVSASSPDLPSPSIRQSRNPFLDVFGDDDRDIFGGEGDNRTGNQSNTPNQDKPQQKKADVEDLLINLTIDDSNNSKNGQKGREQPRRSPGINGDMRPPPPGGPRPQQRPPNGPPRHPRGPPPSYQHHHTHSSEGTSANGRALISPGANPRAPGNQPRGREDRAGPNRPRSNSESSVMDKADKDRNRDRRRNEKSRDDKSKDDKSKKSSNDSRRKKGSPLDIIDKLDVTGIYGGGFSPVFHHDGPFDACNPHRNKNKNKAPMQAFPEGSKNNVLTGFDFGQRTTDHSHVFGNRDPEAYLDFAMPAGGARRGSAGLEPIQDHTRPSSKRALSFDPINRPIVHGDESLGLGTSTFLEGAPAAKKAIEKAQAQEDDLRPTTSGGFKDSSGLQRKKSLAQKIRSISQSKPAFDQNGERIAPGFDRRHKPSKSNSPTEGSYPDMPFSPQSPPPPPPINRAAKAGGVQIRDDSAGDDYDAAWDKKGETIQEAEEERRGNRDRAPSSPKKAHPGIGRAGSDSRVPQLPNAQSGDAQGSNSGGLLKRVKSLSKGKRRDAS